MSIRAKYEKDLKDLQDKLVYMCRKVQDAIDNSIIALETRDMELADQVIRNDKKINRLENEIEHDCLRLMLMESPVATDFRELSAALKMITDLERIADQASDIANISKQIGGEIKIEKLAHIREMAEIAKTMVEEGVRSYISKDLELALTLNKKDDKIDLLFKTVKTDVIAMIKKDASLADGAIMILMVGKYFERIGDHAVNIGEWVNFVHTGSKK